MKALRQFFAVLAGHAAEAERDNSRLKTAIVIILPVIPIVLCALISYFVFVQPSWFIILALAAALVYGALIILAATSGIIRGVKHGLENPREGETWIDYKDGDDVYWQSLKFTPPNPISGPISISGQTEAPMKYDRWLEWRKVYSYVRPLRAQGTYSEKDLLAKVELNHPTVRTTKTLKKIEKAGGEGMLDDWEKYRKIKGIKN
jgi:uncharacterized membrane protein (GlpM family)